MNPPTPIRISALRPWTIALARPKGGEQHPQHRRRRIGHRRPQIGDADLAADRRHHRLQRGIARRGDQHRGEQQQEMGRRQRRSANPPPERNGAHRHVLRAQRGAGKFERRLPSRKALASWSRRLSGANALSAKLAKPRRICQRSPLRPPRGAFMSVSSARTLERPAPLRAPRDTPGHQPALAVPSRLPQESGDGRVGHSVVANPDRQDARAGRLGDDQVVRRIWPGGRHLHPPDPRKARRPTRRCLTIDTNADFTDYLEARHRRSAAGRGDRVGRRRREDPRRARLRPCRLCPVGPALLDPSAGRRRGDRRRDVARHPPRRRVPGLSIQPQGAATSSSRVFERIERGFEWINVPPATLFWA